MARTIALTYTVVNILVTLLRPPRLAWDADDPHGQEEQIFLYAQRVITFALLWSIYALYRFAHTWMAQYDDMIWFAAGLYGATYCITPDRFYALRMAEYSEYLQASYAAGDLGDWTCPTMPGGCTANTTDTIPCFSHSFELQRVLALTCFAAAIGNWIRMSSDWYLLFVISLSAAYTTLRGTLGDLDSHPNAWIYDGVLFAVLLFLLFLGCRRADLSDRKQWLQLHNAESAMNDLKKELRSLASVSGAFDEISGMPVNKELRSNSSSFKRSREGSGKKARKALVAPFVPASASRTERLVPKMTALPATGSSSAFSHQDRPGEPIRRLLPPETYEPSAVASRREALYKCASRMRDPAYTLEMFLDDLIQCLPELTLYVTSGAPSTAHEQPVEIQRIKSSSGRTAVDEYLRTIGAFSTLYWLSRLDVATDSNSTGLDGQRGFCFGVDEATGSPPSAKELSTLTVDDSWYDANITSRLNFYQGSHWADMHLLLISAGILESDGNNGATRINTARMSAMLALTAIHDIMKLEHLCPMVARSHAPFHGVNAGETIHDHDAALAYLLTHDIQALPCVASLPVADQLSIRFTQADLNFNHGWFVQAEAPPGAIFASMKALLNDGGLKGTEVAFYFVHWLTDLAGATPTPLRGSEKFVLHFPRPVLSTLVASMPFVQKLVETTPTDLYEQYLHFAWSRDVPTSIKALSAAKGTEAIALMRLLIQCQDHAKQRLLQGAFDLMPQEKRTLLANELSLTGVAGERFMTAAGQGSCAGPAMLIYYMPAYLRNCCAHKRAEEASYALAVLAEVLRAARALWPLDESDAACSSCVTIMISELKESSSRAEVIDVYTKGRCWVLQRSSGVNGSVTSKPLHELPGLMAAGGCELLKLWGEQSDVALAA